MARLVAPLVCGAQPPGNSRTREMTAPARREAWRTESGLQPRAQSRAPRKRGAVYCLIALFSYWLIGWRKLGRSIVMGHRHPRLCMLQQRYKRRCRVKTARQSARASGSSAPFGVRWLDTAFCKGTSTISRGILLRPKVFTRDFLFLYGRSFSFEKRCQATALQKERSSQKLPQSKGRI